MYHLSHLTKQQARQQIKLQRDMLSPDYFLDSGQEICKTILSLSCYKSANTIFCYVSTNAEPSTFLLLEQVLNDKKILAVPKTNKTGMMKAVIIHSLSQLTVGQFGLLEPTTEEILPSSKIDFSLIPCVSMSITGQRLGHGGGYYDRFLSQLSNNNYAATCCSKLLAESLPTQPHDQAIPLIVTEKALIFSSH